MGFLSKIFNKVEESIEETKKLDEAITKTSRVSTGYKRVVAPNGDIVYISVFRTYRDSDDVWGICIVNDDDEELFYKIMARNDITLVEMAQNAVVQYVDMQNQKVKIKKMRQDFEDWDGDMSKEEVVNG